MHPDTLFVIFVAVSIWLSVSWLAAIIVSKMRFIPSWFGHLVLLFSLGIAANYFY